MNSSFRILAACRPEKLSEQKYTEQNDSVFRLASWISQNSQITVRGVTTYVRPWPSSSISKLGGKYRKRFKKMSEDTAEQTKLHLQSVGVTKDSWDDTVSVFADGPSEADLLTQAAEDYQADVILLSSDAAASKGRFLAGSTADALLHSSPVPLALMPRQAKLSKKGITRVNYAFSSEISLESDFSFDRAAELASIWQVPLRVISFSPTGIADSPVSDKLGLSKALSTEWREHTLANLDRLSDHVLSKYEDLTVTTEIGSGWGWAGAIEAIKWKKGDLLCLGSHPVDALHRVFSGSDVMEIIRYSPVPTIVYPGK